MRRRKLLRAVALVAVALVALGIVVKHLPAPTSRITRENFERIEPSSIRFGELRTRTRAEVEAILGPPGDYRTGITLNRYVPSYTIIRPSGPSTCLVWEGDSLSIYVDVDSSGEVIFANAMTNLLADQGTAEALLWRAKRLWRHCFP